MPRHGFHSGVWNNHTYYWTEYDPTGALVGNPINDATTNVQSLAAVAVAKAAYYETDATLQKEYPAYAKGLLWCRVRQYTTDGRWYNKQHWRGQPVRCTSLPRMIVYR
jgi:hypothetical protein